MVVVSNWDSSLHRVLSLHGLTPYFERVFASMEEGCAKPDPSFFRIAERHLALPPEQILHVGDNPVDDLEGARSAGWQSILIDRTGQAPGSISTLMGLVDLVVSSS
jgi:putative hydrolase of the HAD superfamily